MISSLYYNIWLLFLVHFAHTFFFFAGCGQYTRDPEHEGRANGPERGGRGAATIAAEGGLVGAQRDGASGRIYTQKAAGGGHHLTCSRQGTRYIRVRVINIIKNI